MMDLIHTDYILPFTVLHVRLGTIDKRTQSKVLYYNYVALWGKKNKHKEEHLISGHKRNFLNKKKLHLEKIQSNTVSLLIFD